MLKTYFILLHLLFSTTLLANESCNNKNEVNIETATIPFEFKLDTTKKTKEITSEIQNQYHTEGYKSLGAVNANAQINVDVQLIEQTKNENLYCGTPDFFVEIGYTDLILLISNDLKKDSCEYNTVYEHELHHLDIYKKSIDNILLLTKEYIKNNHNQSVLTSDIKQYRLDTQKDINNFIINQFNLVKKEQLNFDKEDSKHLHDACNGNLLK